MGEAYKCDRCGALGNKSRICRALNAFPGTCGTCGAHGHTARHYRTTPRTRTHKNTVVASLHDPPACQEHYSSVPPPVAWLQQEGGLVMQGGTQQWNGGGVGGGAQQWDGGGAGGGEPHWDGGGVGDDGQPKPRSGGAGGAYEGGPLSSTIDSQAPASSEQQVEWPTLFVAHLTSLGKWHALSVGGGLVRPTRPGSKILIGDSAASIHCTGDSALFYNKRPPAPDEKYLIIGDGKKMEVQFFGCVDVVMHCAEDVAVTLRNVAFVPGVPFDLCSFNVIQEEHVITLDHEGAHMLDGRVFFRKEKFGNYVEATRVARHEKPPALAAAVLRPGRQRWIDINDLHCSLGHAHDTVLRETARQMGINVTGRLGYCDGCAGGKGIRKAVAKSTSCRAEKRMQRLYADLAGPMPTSTGGARYCLMIVDDATNMGWPVFLPDKSAATVTLGFRTFLAAVNAYGQPECLRTDNASEFTNAEFQRLMVDNNIRREFTSVDGPKRNGRVERKLALVAEGGHAAFLEFQTMFDGVEFPAKALNYERTWPEAWTWMCDALNLMARVDEKPGMMCSFEKFHGRPYRGPVLPYMMPGRHKVKRAAKSEPKGEPCFYLNSGNDHASDCSKIMLSPSGIASYSTDVTWGYRRAPFGGGTAIAGSPSPAKGGAVSDPAQQSQAPRGFEVWYQPSTPSTGVTPESSPTPLPAASSVPQQQKPTSATVASPESLPVFIPPAPPATVAPPESSPAPPPSVEVPVQQQQQPRVSPAVTRSAARQRGGLGPQHGFVSMLAARENIAMIIADQSPPHMPAPELPSCPASELVTPDSYREACEDEHGDVWFDAMDTEFDGLYRAGTFGAVVDKRCGDT